MSDTNFQLLLNKPLIEISSPGIYGIISESHGHIYIGSSDDILRRKKQHLSALRHNKHHCKYLQNSWNKYGENSFKFIVIEKMEIIHEDVAIEKIRRFRYEQKYIDLFSGTNYLYNSTKTVGQYKNFSISIDDRLKELTQTYAYKYISLSMSDDAENKLKNLRREYNIEIEKLAEQFRKIEDKSIEYIEVENNTINCGSSKINIYLIYASVLIEFIICLIAYFRFPYYDYPVIGLSLIGIAITCYLMYRIFILKYVH